MEDSTGKNRGNMAIYPPVNIQKAIENGPFIVDLLIYPFKMVIFHRFLYVYQRFLHDFSMKIHGGALRRWQTWRRFWDFNIFRKRHEMGTPHGGFSLPSGKHTKNWWENHHAIHGKTHSKLPFSIANCWHHQRVTHQNGDFRNGRWDMVGICWTEYDQPNTQPGYVNSLRTGKWPSRNSEFSH